MAFGRIHNIKPAAMRARAANIAKIPLSGICASRRLPNPQSAKPPQPMLTKFINPYPVARTEGCAIWQRIGMLLQSKRPQPRPKSVRNPTAMEREDELPTPKSAGASNAIPMALVKIRPR